MISHLNLVSQFVLLVDLICDAIENKDDEEKLEEIKNMALELCKKFPVYNKKFPQNFTNTSEVS